MLPTVEQKWQFIVDAIMVHLDEKCPMRTFTFKDYQKEWMDNEVLEAMRDRDDLVVEHKRFPTDLLWHELTNARQYVDDLIRQKTSNVVTDK